MSCMEELYIMRTCTHEIAVHVCAHVDPHEIFCLYSATFYNKGPIGSAVSCPANGGVHIGEFK